MIQKNKSWDWGHIEELINYLELANLLTTSGKTFGYEREVCLNTAEVDTIKIFISACEKPLAFKISKLDRDTVEERKAFKYTWDLYNASLSDKSKYFDTSLEAFGIRPLTPLNSETGYKAIIGKIGEKYIFDYEVSRVSKIDLNYSTYEKNRADVRGIRFVVESIYAVGATPLKKKRLK